jgi:hypothetical protein
MSKSNFLLVCLSGVLVLIGGCASCFPPPNEAILAGNWSLTTDVSSDLPATVLFFDSLGQLTKIEFTLDSGVVVGTSPASVVTVTGSTVAINILIGQGSINFLGTLDEAQNVATGTLNAALTLGGATITLPGVDATLTRLLLD